MSEQVPHGLRLGWSAVLPRGLALALAVSLAMTSGCNNGGNGHTAATPTATLAVAPTPAATTLSTQAPTATLVPTAMPTAVPTATPTNAPTATPTGVPGPIAMRRLTEAQYKATIADVLGAHIAVAGRIEPDNRRSGLLAVGSSFVSVTGAGFEQYEALARSIAEQALNAAHRGALVPCVPRATTDDDCAEEFIRAVGGRLLRRPLTEADIAPRLLVASQAAAVLGDFHAGLEAALASLLLAPEFLFRVEVVEPNPDQPSRQRLTDASMAARLSYLLWNTTPDDELLAAAARGELVDGDGLARQVDRLLDSPRLEDAVRALFADLYGFEEIEQGLVRKDPALFPAFSQALIDDAREQTLRVITDHLLTREADYRELFTTRSSFMTRTLGIVYRVPVRTAEGWEPFEFPDGGERAGLLSHVSLLALRSHPGRSSPTLRGKFVREVLLCQDVPPPPGDIDFSMFAEEGGANRRTARERLTVHVSNQVCAGCHSLMDPIGLALEKMDGIGAYREMENGVAIDPSGELDGVPFADAIGLGEVLSHNPALGPCFVESLYKYAVGRDVVPGERAFLADLQAQLESSGYRLRDMLRAIALSDGFRAASGAREAEATPVPTTPNTPAAGTPTPTPSPRQTSSAATATPGVAEPTATPTVVTLQQVQDAIFSPRCATQFCHSAQTHSGGMVLAAGASFENLVGALPMLPAPREAGLLRVDPFAPENSFLLIKLGPQTGSAFGSRMPLIGAPLSEEEIGLIRAWILAGANP